MTLNRMLSLGYFSGLLFIYSHIHSSAKKKTGSPALCCAGPRLAYRSAVTRRGMNLINV